MGCHNERHEFAFTSIEAVADNVFRFCERVEPASVRRGPAAVRGYRGDRIYTLNRAVAQGLAIAVVSGLVVVGARRAGLPTPSTVASVAALAGALAVVFYLRH